MRQPLLAVLLFALLPVQAPAADTGKVQRQVAGNRTTENVPEVPAELLERLDRYQNTRGASLAGWTRDGCLLVSTRFAETAQAHRVCMPLGMREQLTFYPEPVAGLTPAPPQTWRDGFVFAKDRGGDEFSQLYWFDAPTRATVLLTDGQRSQNGGVVISRDGGLLAYSSTARNGTDRDVWVRDTRTGQSRAVLTEGGTWGVSDFSHDGQRLLVGRYVSANETYPGELDLASGKLTMFPVDGGKAALGQFRYAPDGKGVFYVSDEDVAGKVQQFRTLRHHGPGTGAPKLISAHIPWDVDEVRIAGDGRHLAYTTNEDGISRLHLLRLPGLQPVALPALRELPVGVIGNIDFSPDGQRLALDINSATSPSDVYVVDLAGKALTRWTRSEVGGLDASAFVAPTLVRYPTFDQVDGQPRTIPAFYYRPAKPAASGKHPVLINIHGGPEAQSHPVFNPSIQFMLADLGVAVLVPNVRGSSGYGKDYLQADNGFKREDSVKDIGALLDWIAQQPELDASRVGVYGGSYGGYMVLSSLMHYSDRIKAGIDVVGISDFRTFLKNTESYRRDLRRAEYGDERDPEMAAFFEQIAPLRHADRIRAPLFVAQGRNDPRVPWTEAVQIVEAVRGNGQPMWYLEFADEGHGFRKKANSDYFSAASMLFWQRHLLDPAPRTFAEPRAGLHTGGQPSAQDLARLQAQGVRTVIDLRTPGEDRGFDQAAEARRLGLAYVALPIAGKDDITAANATALQALLEQHGDGVLLHCGSGNRVGALLALGAAQGGASHEEALALGRQAGLTSWEPVVVERLEAETAR
ncbi:prolyl oligopeptidase family serine peptidase [Pseudoxanthomonas suwonensis]|uniref:prolyl oligopeptidase family serine peptidase n=1 Tax=Pseudoxanthomonas suwonensis TaxID=314722 RepID=UPI0006986276|nr:prolyl oligopeptidase family serine peptidase [Pseudoxanthomonas suwonensis]